MRPRLPAALVVIASALLACPRAGAQDVEYCASYLCESDLTYDPIAQDAYGYSETYDYDYTGDMLGVIAYAYDSSDNVVWSDEDMGEYGEAYIGSLEYTEAGTDWIYGQHWAVADGDSCCVYEVGETEDYAYFPQIPTYLSVVGSGTQSAEAPCEYSGGTPTSCGSTLQLTYQVLDQTSQPIHQSLAISDGITATSNGCNLTSFATTPPGTYTNADGTFSDTLFICSGLNLCCNGSGSCIAACETDATQYWVIGPGEVVLRLSYKCNQISVGGVK